MNDQTISILRLGGIAALFYSLIFFVFFITSLLVEPVNNTTLIDMLNSSMINTLVYNRCFFGVSFIFLGYFGGTILALENKLIPDQFKKFFKAILLLSLLLFFFFTATYFLQTSILFKNIVVYNTMINDRWFFGAPIVILNIIGLFSLFLITRNKPSPKPIKILRVIVILTGFICSIIGLYMLITIS